MWPNKERNLNQFKPLPEKLAVFESQLKKKQILFPLPTQHAGQLFDGIMTPNEAFNLMEWLRRAKIIEPMVALYGKHNYFRWDLDRMLVLAQARAILGEVSLGQAKPEIVYQQLKTTLAGTRLESVISDPAEKLIFREPPHSSSKLEKLGDLNLDKILALKRLTNSWDKAEPLLRSQLIKELQEQQVDIRPEFLDTLVFLDGIAIEGRAVSYSMCTKGDFTKAVNWYIGKMSDNIKYDLTMVGIVRKIEDGLRLKMPSV